MLTKSELRWEWISWIAPICFHFMLICKKQYIDYILISLWLFHYRFIYKIKHSFFLYTAFKKDSKRKKNKKSTMCQRACQFYGHWNENQIEMSKKILKCTEWDWVYFNRNYLKKIYNFNNLNLKSGFFFLKKNSK